MDFDLEELVNIEQTFYEEGYKDGFAHGRIHGLIEGRALGREKGFEMWEELGFYQGFAMMWKAIVEGQAGQDECAYPLLTEVCEEIRYREGRPLSLMGMRLFSESGSTPARRSSIQVAHRLTRMKRRLRTITHIRHLLELIAQFPRENPSATGGPSELDIPKLFRQIRSRYKLLCATLGVRPTLRALDGSSVSPDRAAVDSLGSSARESPQKPQGARKNVWAVQSPGESSASTELSF